MSSLNSPFAEAAHELWDKGMAVIPCPGSDGKSPKGAICNYQHWKSRPSLELVDEMVSKWPGANIGAVTHASGVTVIDIDGDEKLAQEMLNLLGPTPLVTATPSGGRHHWYRHNGERCGNLRRRHSLPVDIKGKGGVIIVPPSRSFSNGGSYRLLKGTFDDLQRLPVANPNAFKKFTSKQSVDAPEGQRNNNLFYLGLDVAPNFDIFEDFHDYLKGLNAGWRAPLPMEEVKKTASSAWGYEQRGQNFVGHGPYTSILELELGQLARGAYAMEALWLLVRLKLAHGSKTDAEFAISPDAMARGKLVPMSRNQIRRARGVLLECGLLKQVAIGGRGPGDPALFRFGSLKPAQ